MHHSGRLTSDDDKQQYILIDEEDITADVGEQQPPRSSMQRGNEYQLTAYELNFRKKNIDSFKFAQSKVSDEGWLIKRALTQKEETKQQVNWSCGGVMLQTLVLMEQYLLL